MDNDEPFTGFYSVVPTKSGWKQKEKSQWKKYAYFSGILRGEKSGRVIGNSEG